MSRGPGRLSTARNEDADLQRAVYGRLGARELTTLEPDVEVDALGTFCPEPVIRIQNRMRGLAPATVVLLWADDSGVEVDIPAWCLSTGNEFLGIIRDEHAYRVFVRKGCR